MVGKSDQKGYFEAVSRRNWITWILSGLIAAGLNLGLFLMMPHLMDSMPDSPAVETVVSQINVIRIKRPETKVKRETVKPPEPKSKVRQVRHSRPNPRKPQAVPKLTLPFEINPRLPSGPTTLDLPPMESAPVFAATDLPDVFSEGELDSPLTVLSRIPPVYPMRAKRRGIEGWVRVSFIVDETGGVRQIYVVEAEPEGMFEKNVQRCVAGWRFKPCTVGGMPVKARAETTIRFELK